MTTNNEKMTYVRALTYVIENYTDMPEDVAEKLEALRAQTEKRHSSSDKPTKAQTENTELANQLYMLMLEKTGKYTVSEWMSFGEPFSEMSNQKVSALMRILEKAGKVVKSAEKRKSYFKAVQEPEPENEGV